MCSSVHCNRKDVKLDGGARCKREVRGIFSTQRAVHIWNKLLEEVIIGYNEAKTFRPVHGYESFRWIWPNHIYMGIILL